MSVEAMASVLHHSNASGTDKLVLLCIANHEGEGGAWPSVETLANYCNCSERSVQRSIRRLVGMGELRVTLHAGGTDVTRSDRRPNRYDVLVRCPDGCDRSTNHRSRGDKSGTNGVTNVAERGDISGNGVTNLASRGDKSGTNGVTPVSPEPSLEPPINMATIESYSRRLAKRLRDQGEVINPGQNLHESFRNLLTCAYASEPEEQHHGITLGVIADFVSSAAGPKMTSEARAHTARLLKTHERLKVFDGYGQAMQWGAGIGDRYQDDPLALSKYVAAILGGKR
jgi:hypothetical protein